MSLAECNKECTAAPSARDAGQAKSGNIRGGKKFEMNDKLRQLAHNTLVITPSDIQTKILFFWL